MNSENTNYTTLALTLELLTTSQKYLEEYIKTFPDMEENALSFSVDPGCSCKTAIIEHFNKNLPAIESINTTFIHKNPTEVDLKQFLAKLEVKNVAGKFFKIEKTEEAYFNFVQNMKEQRWAFRHISVTTDNDSYVIFFA